jgi:hypothetical protein
VAEYDVLDDVVFDVVTVLAVAGILVVEFDEGSVVSVVEGGSDSPQE